MTLKTFYVEYTNGVRDVITHEDLESVEQFCNAHFGSTWEHAVARGARVIMTDHNPAATPVDMPARPDVSLSLTGEQSTADAGAPAHVPTEVPSPIQDPALP